MQKFEKDYARLVSEILEVGEHKSTRNGIVRGVFGRSLTVPVGQCFPIIQGRKMYIKGILGEFAAMIRQPKSVEDFAKWGCNYWNMWADTDGMLDVDYGNAWFDFNGYDQIAALRDMLNNDPTSRRMIVSSWRPDKLSSLSLPCCHYSYQFYVREGRYLDMIWTQRSVDMMIGLPSDIVLGAIWLLTLSNEVGLIAGNVKFDLGDCHVYAEHFSKAQEYLEHVQDNTYPLVAYSIACRDNFCDFEPGDLVLPNYEHGPVINFVLKG